MDGASLDVPVPGKRRLPRRRTNIGPGPVSAEGGYGSFVPATETDLEERSRAAILDLLADRGPEKTICPSEAARALAGSKDFRPYMDPVRDAAAKLAQAGRIEVTQKGEPVKIGEVRGPIRLGQTDKFGDDL